MEDNYRRNDISLTTKVIKLDEKIAEFDSILEQLQEHIPEDMRFYDAVVAVRDKLFQLSQIMHGVEIVDFACGNRGGDI